jgi:hypothetical protein
MDTVQTRTYYKRNRICGPVKAPLPLLARLGAAYRAPMAGGGCHHDDANQKEYQESPLGA